MGVTNNALLTRPDLCIYITWHDKGAAKHVYIYTSSPIVPQHKFD